MKNPTTTEKNTLVALARLKHGAAVSNNVKVEQKADNALRKKIDSLASKYPHVDMQSEAFFSHLWREAKKAWEAPGFRGPGKDW